MNGFLIWFGWKDQDNNWDVREVCIDFAVLIGGIGVGYGYLHKM